MAILVVIAFSCYASGAYYTFCGILEVEYDNLLLFSDITGYSSVKYFNSNTSRNSPTNQHSHIGVLFGEIHIQRHSTGVFIAVQANLATLPLVCQNYAIWLTWRFGLWSRLHATSFSIFVHLLVQKPIITAIFHILLYVNIQNFVKTLEKFTEV